MAAEAIDVLPGEKKDDIEVKELCLWRNVTGALLGVILYILYINPGGFPSEISISISGFLHYYWIVLDTILDLTTNSETPPPTVQSIKFMDDATIQEKIILKTELDLKSQTH